MESNNIKQNTNFVKEKNDKIYLKTKLDVAKYIKHVITDFLSKISQGSMFVYNGYVYNVYIK